MKLEIEHLISGNDNLVCGVEVYNTNSDTIILLCRPLQPIVSFELYEFSNTEKTWTCRSR